MTGFYEGTDGIQQPVPHELTTHEDVELTSPADEDILYYNLANLRWENKPNFLNGTLTELDDVLAPTPSADHALVFNGTNWVSGTIQTGGPISLNGLTDVTITGIPGEGERIEYQSGFWVNVPGSGNSLTIGSGIDTNKATLVLDSGTIAGDTSVIEFQNGSAPTWSITNDIADLEISDGTSTLVFDGTAGALNWNKNLNITDGGNLVVDGTITAGAEIGVDAGVNADTYLRFADASVDNGIFWGVETVATTALSVASGNTLTMKHLAGLTLDSYTAEPNNSFIRVEQDRVIMGAKNAGNDSTNSLFIDDLGANSSFGFTTPFSYKITGDTGWFVSPNDAVTGIQCPNWAQVQAWVTANFISK